MIGFDKEKTITYKITQEEEDFVRKTLYSVNEALIEKGCSVKARSRSGNTPLHITGNKEVAIYLCK